MWMTIPAFKACKRMTTPIPENPTDPVFLCTVVPGSRGPRRVRTTAAGRVVVTVSLVAGLMVSLGLFAPVLPWTIGAGSTAHAQSSSVSERLQEAGVATSSELKDLEREYRNEIERINREREANTSRLEDQIEELERRLSRIEKARQVDERRAEQASFEKSRMLNWPKTKSGMNRRQIYRLVGSGVKDRTETLRDCRCYSQGRICFNDEDLAQKSNVRCQL